MMLLRGVGKIGGGAALDPDVQAFVTASGIADSTQIAYATHIVEGLKLNGTWNKWLWLGGMVGEAAFAHSFNMRNATSGTFYGGGTHDANGYWPNGSNAYLNTSFIPDTDLPGNTVGMSFYCGNDDGNGRDMGCLHPGTGDLQMLIKFSTNRWIVDAYSSSCRLEFLMADSRGYTSYNRTADNFHFLSKNGTVKLTGNNIAGSRPGIPVFVGAVNNYGVIYQPSMKNCRFFGINTGLTSEEDASCFQVVEEAQIILNRSAL